MQHISRPQHIEYIQLVKKNALLFAYVQFLLYLCNENEEVIYHSTRGIEACAAACVLCAMQFGYRRMVVRT